MAYVGGVIFTVAIYTLLRSVYTKYSFYWLFDQQEPQPLTDFVGLSFVYGVWFTVISSMLFISQNWYEQQERIKAAEVNQLETELKYLRAQMNPHFLFNGLNTIYGSIDQGNQQAREILLQFSDLLRYTIYDADADFVLLEKEINHIENYVALQRARSNSNINIELSIQLTRDQVSIAPMLFIPLLENAFKFVTQDDQTDNYISVSLIQTDESIRFTCRNSCDEVPQDSIGIGLVNIRRRLELLYPGKHAISIERTKTEYAIDLTLVL